MKEQISVPECLRIGELIQIPSKNTVLMFCESNFAEGQVWQNRRSKWGEWEQIEGLGFKQDVSVVLSSDENFVIIAEGRSVRLHILDIRSDKKYLLRESAVKVPFSHTRGTLARTGGKSISQTIVSGWIRSLAKSKAFIGLDIPIVIIQAIKSWYSFETIHYINEGIHLVIPLTDVLYSKL